MSLPEDVNWDKRITSIAEDVFGIKQLRPFQYKIIDAVLDGYDVFCVVPTGAGKSVTFQIPSQMKREFPGLTIVFTPLISLMKDQVDQLHRIGIRAVRLGSDMDRKEVDYILDNLEDYTILYVAPERLKSDKFWKATKRSGVDLIVVDECHVTGSKISSPTGFKDVDKITVGDIIYGWDKGRVVEVKVKSATVKEHLGDLVCLQYGSRFSTMTPNHPVYLLGVGFVPVSAINEGDEIVEEEKLLEVWDTVQHRGEKIACALLLPDLSEADESYTLNEVHPHLSDMQQGVRGREEGCDVLLKPVLGETDKGKRKDNSDMPELRSSFYSEEVGPEHILFSRVFEIVIEGEEDLPTLLEGLHREKVINKEILLKGVCVLRFGSLFVGTYDAEKSNALARSALLHVISEKGDRSIQRGYERWKREKGNESTDNNDGLVSRSSGGIAYCYRKEEGWDGLFYVCGFGFCRGKGDSGVGRGFAQEANTEKMGYGEGLSTSGTRVASITVREQFRGELRGESGGTGTKVYSIEVEGGTYFADGLLVHNCHSLSRSMKDFRASYMRIGEFCDEHQNAAFMALTATADNKVYSDVRNIMGFRDTVKIVASPIRKNLHYEIVKEMNPMNLVTKISNIKSKAATGPILVYCATRKMVETLADILNRAGLHTLGYHGGMESKDRTYVQEAFLRDAAEVMVATNAFGMGINKRNIRGIIHYQVPNSVFDYIQEVGRGGRDGKDCFCVLNISNDGIKTQRFLNRNKNPEMTVYRNIWEYLRQTIATYGKHGEITVSKSKLGFVSGAGKFYAGKVDTAINVMEYHGMIETVPGLTVYELPILDAGKARSLCNNTQGATIVGSIVKIVVPPGSYDPSDVFLESRACRWTEPKDMIKIKIKDDEFKVTQSDISDKEDEDEKKLAQVLEFATTTNKEAFIEAIFMEKQA